MSKEGKNLNLSTYLCECPTPWQSDLYPGSRRWGTEDLGCPTWWCWEVLCGPSVSSGDYLWKICSLGFRSNIVLAKTIIFFPCYTYVKYMKGPIITIFSNSIKWDSSKECNHISLVFTHFVKRTQVLNVTSIKHYNIVNSERKTTEYYLQKWRTLILFCWK